MTNPDDKTPAPAPDTAPSWVDDVLNSSSQAGAPTDLRISDEPRQSAPAPSWLEKPAAPQPAAPAPSWVDELAASPTAPLPPSSQPPAAPYDLASGAPANDDWVTRATGGARNPTVPQGPPTAPAISPRPFDAFGDPSRQMAPSFGAGPLSSDVSQKKMIAGLLAIFLGSLGVHKFFLGQTTPGLLTLGVNVGVWIVALLLGVLTLGAGLLLTIPLAALVSSALGLLGLVEGIIYLTKSDSEFQRDYLLGGKAWL
ncbi:NINE protein [Deinococcus sp. HMF7620]|uniref:NINE protein n=1 Tax=Deinococcus arboris TaxID=2682977 RepID=A0A7C9HWM6_9DEIO|nr:NINE protein [Deinococcus arboris]MVN85890.1 NINE protein [Deinococcus arboris]